MIADGAIELGGRLPVNPHGGQLGEAYIHGVNGIAEAVRQVRGTSANQVPGDGPVLVTAGTGVPPAASSSARRDTAGRDAQQVTWQGPGRRRRPPGTAFSHLRSGGPSGGQAGPPPASEATFSQA